MEPSQDNISSAASIMSLKENTMSANRTTSVSDSIAAVVSAPERPLDAPRKGEVAVRYDRDWTIDYVDKARLERKLGDYRSARGAIEAGLARPGTEIVVREGSNQFGLYESSVDLEKTKANGGEGLYNVAVTEFRPGVVAVVGTGSATKVNPDVQVQLGKVMARLEQGALTLDQIRSLAGEAAAQAPERWSPEAPKAFSRYLVALYKERGVDATAAALEPVRLPYTGPETGHLIETMLSAGNTLDAAKILLRFNSYMHPANSHERETLQAVENEVTDAVVAKLIAENHLDVAMRVVSTIIPVYLLDGERPALVKALARRGRIADALEVTHQMDAGPEMVRAYASVIEKVLPRDANEAERLLTECEAKLRQRSAEVEREHWSDSMHDYMRRGLTMWSKLHTWVHDGGPGGTFSFAESQPRELRKVEHRR